MNRVSIFNWLPIADNMLPEINSKLISLGHSSSIDKDSVLFTVSAIFKLKATSNHSIKYQGKINQRGFSQVVWEISPIPEMSLSSTLNDLVPQFQDHIANLLIDICPFAVRNKFSIINEGIVSFQEFESSKFETSIAKYAISSLKKHSYLSMQVDSDYKKEIELGFNISSLNLSIPSGSKQTSVFTNKQQTYFLFYSENYSSDEKHPFDNIIYKYFAFLTFSSLVSRAIEILKNTRDHIVPLRRHLSIALQRRTEEYLDTLVDAKKYLTYINIKLPVVHKVINHLNDARSSTQFKAKINAFATEKISSYPTIECINKSLKKEALGTETIINKINENAGEKGRLQYLFNENEDEASKFSFELSQILQGSFLSENVQKLTKVVQTLRNQLEVARGGKHRENALKGLSIILFANTMVALTEKFGLSGFQLIIIFIVSGFGAWGFIEWTINQKGSYFQIEIPINKVMNRGALRDFTRHLSLKRSEIRGESRQKTWTTHFFVDQKLGSQYFLNKKFNSLKNPFSKKMKGTKAFDLTLDYEKHGYVHAIQLEAEHKNTDFDFSFLVFQIIYLLKKNDVITVQGGNETSLYVELLSNLDINVDPKLEGLNSILTMPKDDLDHAIQTIVSKSNNRDETALTRDDTALFEDIVKRSNEYLYWLMEKQKNSDIERELYGENNLELKIEVIRQIKARQGE